MPFLNLPDEIIVRILCHLEPCDINNLCGVTSIRQRLQQFISLTIDDDTSIAFPNIPIESRIIINGDSELNCAGLLELFEINNFTLFNRKLSSIEDRLPKFCVIRDPIEWMQQSIFQIQHTRGQDLDLFTKLIGDASENNSAIKKLSFIHLTKILLENITIDPFSIHLPNLESAAITNCQSANVSTKFKWNKLKAISITGPRYFESLHQSMDYESYPIDLSLNNIGHIRLSNINFSTLKMININNEPDMNGTSLNDTVVIDNCNFPNLRELNIGVQNGLIIERVALPSLLKLSLECTSGQIILNEVQSNNVQAVELTASRFPLVRNFQSSSLRLVYLDIENFREDDDFSFFQNIPNLILKNHVVGFLSKTKLSKLNFLGLDLRLPSDLGLGSMEFPNLECLDISLDNNYHQIPFINAPNLKQLNVADSPRLTDLDNIPSDFPNLEELLLEMVQLPLTMNKLTFPNLKSFEINMEGDALNICECRFPKLKSFFAIGSMFQTESSIDIDAENLVEMKIENLDIDELVLPNNKKLQCLSANRVEFLSAKNLDSLIYLDLSYNIMRGMEIESAPNLRLFEAIQSNAEAFGFVSGLLMSRDEKLEKFGARYKPELETIPLEEPRGVRSWMAKFYWDLNKTIRRDLST